MTQAPGFLGSSIGRKVIMAVTGLILVGFVLGHMVGNLQVYLPDGPEALNHYGALLRQLLHGAALWVVRLVLLLAVALHIWSATSLTLESRRARPEGYRERQWTESTYASRTMRWGGVIILFVRDLSPAALHDRHGPSQVRRGRRVPQLRRRLPKRAGLALLHRRHAGARAAPAARGVEHVPDAGCLAPALHPLGPLAAWLVAVLVVVGNISFPIAVLAGIVK